MANFKPQTRYTGGQIAKNRESQSFLVLRTPLNLSEDEGDIFITLTQEHLKRPDLLSFQVYGTPDLWWAIYEFNGIKDPLFDPKINQILRIPEISRLTDAINAQEQD